MLETMIYLKPVLVALVLALPLAPAGVRAQEPAPAAKEGAAKPPARPAVPPKRKPLKRRSVQQVIEPTPPIVTDGYRPTLVIRPPLRAPSPLPVAPPVRFNSCDGGGCTDTSGARYNGPGPAVTGPQGQLCVKGLVNAQCF
jgi:hypothetical protein